MRKEETVMADIKNIVRRTFEELFNQGDFNVADQVFAAEFIGHDPALAQEIHGPDEFKLYVRMYRTAFPDLDLTIEDQFSDGNEVVTRFTARGTHNGELYGIPPTGRCAVVTGISIDRVISDKIVESWTNYDMLGLMRQLGFVLARQAPQPSAEAAQPQAG
jgi:steroid delta-isomerase-like uncharacterized protein